MFQLVVEEEDRTLTFPLGEGEHVVGSATGCGVRLGHPTVSGRHARLGVADGCCVVEDLGSRNGTRVDGRRVGGSSAVEAGSVILFGTQAARLEEVTEGDLEPAVSFTGREADEPEGSTGGGPRPTTAATGSLEVFVLESLPAILDKLDEEAALEEVVRTAAAALYETLPCLSLEVRSAAGGVVFTAARVDGAAGTEVAVENRALSLVVRFAHETQARGFRPVVESAARLALLAARRRPTTGSDRGREAPPPLPDPPTVDPAVRRIYRDAARVARGDVSVMICGESGTGKEVLARYVHAASPRRNEPFVALNCAALPTDLLEAELFGIEVGVATGVEARPGKFELADGGTLFLDEIGDMATPTQAKILRVLQEREIYRVGGRKPRSAKVRVIAATNRDLDALLASGEFRTDLYHRIADWTVELPPLRQRLADVPNLAAHFLSAEARRRGVELAGISKAAMEALGRLDWPGNVRQLEREMARAALFLGDGQMLQEAHLRDAIRDAGSSGEAGTDDLRSRLEAVERREIVAALRTRAGNLSAAARDLGIARTTLYRRMEQLVIEPCEFDSSRD